MKDANEWREECAYISRGTDRRGDVPEMGEWPTRLASFIVYCEMQRNSATREGYDDVAQYIQHCLDDLEGMK